MNGCEARYENICKGGFAAIHTKLDRLEAAERSRNRLIWIITGAAVTLAVSAVWQRIFGG